MPRVTLPLLKRSGSVTKDMHYEMHKTKKQVPQELLGKNFKKDIRDIIITYLGRIKMPDEL